MDDNALKYFAIANLSMGGLQNVGRALRGQPTAGIDNSPLFLLLKQQEEAKKKAQAAKLGEALATGMDPAQAEKIKMAAELSPETAAASLFPKSGTKDPIVIMNTGRGIAAVDKRDLLNPDGTLKATLAPGTAPSTIGKTPWNVAYDEEGKARWAPGVEDMKRTEAEIKAQYRPPSSLDSYVGGMAERDDAKYKQQLTLDSIKAHREEYKKVPEAYQAQQRVYDTVKELNNVLSGEDTGSLTRATNYINKMAKELGMPVDQEKIGKLDTARYLAGELTIRYMKEFGGNDTQEERDFIEQMQPSDFSSPVGRKMAEYISKRRLEYARFENRLVKEGESYLREGTDPLKVQDYMDLKRQEFEQERQKSFNPDKDIKIDKNDLKLLSPELRKDAEEYVAKGGTIPFSTFLEAMRGIAPPPAGAR